MKKPNIKVALLLRDNHNDENIALKKKMLISYCEQKNYEIVDTLILDKLNGMYDLYEIVEFIQKNERSIDTLLAYDLIDFTDYVPQLIALYEILMDYDIYNIESITDGVVGVDVLLNSTINYNVLQKSEYYNNRLCEVKINKREEII